MPRPNDKPLAETHDVRACILEVFAIDGGRTLSPIELTYELQARYSKVSYHVRELFKAGVIRRAHRRQVRGTTEGFYCMVEHSAEDLSL